MEGFTRIAIMAAGAALFIAAALYPHTRLYSSGWLGARTLDVGPLRITVIVRRTYMSQDMPRVSVDWLG